MLPEDKLRQIKDYYFQLIPDLTEETWQSAAGLFTIRHLKKGDLLFKPGVVCNYVSYINYGLLRSYYLIDGKEIVTVFFCEDCYCSDYQSFLSQKPCVRYTEVLEDCELIDLTFDDVQFLFQSFPHLERVGRLIAEMLYVKLENRSDSFVLDTPEQRYQKLLEEEPYLFQRVPQYMIASYLGITPEALSRIRSRISRNKVE